MVATGRRLADMADLPAAERVVLELTGPASIEAAMAAAGRPEVVINNAAMTERAGRGPTSRPGRAGGDQCPGPLRAMQAVLPTMRERGAGRILNIFSSAGRFARPGGVYSASKAALEMLSEAIGSMPDTFGVQVMS